MPRKRLARDFFNRKTLIVAKELLGKFLVRKIGKKVITVMITETEAYCGSNDLASHASRGRTKRTETMFGPPGHAYVYLIYGMYNCFNIVTESRDYPAAVLIRAATLSLTTCDVVNRGVGVDGPGKLCRYLKIDRSLNGEDLIGNQKLWFEDRGNIIKPGKIKRSPRIGIDYAGIYKDKPWRFVLNI